jgi:hypothetical protein
VPASASVQAPSASLTETFTYHGAQAQTVVVPEGATIADVRIIGGKGGSAKNAGRSITGGDGALVTGALPVTAGQLLILKVAGYGGDATGYNHDANPGPGGWGATGNGGRGGGGSSVGDGGGGGGASGLQIGGETILAGGGGGAGGYGFRGTGDPGGPGGSSGATVDPGHNGSGSGAGKGGGGGANGAPVGGGGGNGTFYGGGGGGGGGAGSAGGGGGTGGGFGGGGGGGGGAGSSHLTTRLSGASVVRGSTSDGNGLIVITWNNVSAPVCFGQDVDVPFDSPGVPVRLHCSDASRITSFRLGTLPAHGHLQNLNLSAGTFSYVPDHGYAGPDSLMYQALTGDQASVPYTVTFNVGLGEAPMHLTASETNVTLGHPLVLTVTMPADATGIVGFYNDSLPGADKGIGIAPIIDGVATLTTPTRELVPGINIVHASYGGDAHYLPSESNHVVIIASEP